MSEQAKHFDSGKLRMDLIPPEAEIAIAEVLTYGSKKYGDRNWEKGMPWSKPWGSMRRHLMKHQTGELVDPESGLPHLYHALCNLAFLVTYQMRGSDQDDVSGFDIEENKKCLSRI
jgi:hypothetical protein